MRHEEFGNLSPKSFLVEHKHWNIGILKEQKLIRGAAFWMRSVV